jgi:hypothetical protein
VATSASSVMRISSERIIAFLLMRAGASLQQLW